MNENDDTFLVEFRDDMTDYVFMFEDDGKVAYGYLLYQRKIVGDVWMYNRKPAPGIPEWTDHSKAPFLNAQEYTNEEDFKPVTQSEELEVRWWRTGRELDAADLYIRGAFHARLSPGSKPGWCALAVKDGPCAKVLK